MCRKKLQVGRWGRGRGKASIWGTAPLSQCSYVPAPSSHNLFFLSPSLPFHFSSPFPPVEIRLGKSVKWQAPPQPRELAATASSYLSV